MGVVDEADHGGTHGGHGGGKREMAEHPLQAGGPCRSGVAVSGKIEVCPPGPEAHHYCDQADAEGEAADRPGVQSGDDAADGLADLDDGEQPEPFDGGVGDGERGPPAPGWP
jgi:hypothetical protein